jgi:hypothetical protein
MQVLSLAEQKQESNEKRSLLTSSVMEVSIPEQKTFVNGPLIREKIVTGKTTKIEKGHPRITPAAATETAAAYFSKRKSAEESVTAYMEKLLGRKPIKREKVTTF